MRSFAFFFAFLVCLSSCSHNSKKNSNYIIAIDPTWYPLNVEKREKNILAFSIELLTEIAKVENLRMSVKQMNWNNLLWGLQKGEYNAILSTIRPYSFYLKEYVFSKPYLLTGPVIILPKNVKSNSIDGKEIGVVKGSSSAILLQTTPNILIQGYDSNSVLFEALQNEEVDGISMEVLMASSYMRDLFPDKFRIASDPLNEVGLRLISIAGEEKSLIKLFNQGLSKLKIEGEYDRLLKKWGLSAENDSPKNIDNKAAAFIKDFF